MGAGINRQWRLAACPTCLIKESDFKWKEGTVPTLSQARSHKPPLDFWRWILYVQPVGREKVMSGGTIGVVEQSKNPWFTEGAIVQGFLKWEDYSITNCEGLVMLPNNALIPLTAHYGLFGISDLPLTSESSILESPGGNGTRL